MQQVELYRPEDGAPGDFRPPDWLTKEQGTRNGEEKTRNEERATGNGDLGDGVPQPPGDEPGTQSPGPTLAEKVTSEPQPATPNPPPSDQPAVAIARRTALRIELRETEDEVADRDRLQRLLATLGEFAGDDDVRLTVHTLDGASKQVALPSARACPELLERLSEVLGEAGSVAVRS